MASKSAGKQAKKELEARLKREQDNAGAMAAAQQFIKLQQEANKPAIQAYEAQIPQVQQSYQQQRQFLTNAQAPLAKRYDDLIASIKGEQTTAENRTINSTNNELGRRGITGSSTLAQQQIADTVNPVTRSYAGIGADAGADKEAAMTDLSNKLASSPLEEANSINGIRTAIGQLQAGASSNGIQQGLNLYQFNQGAENDRVNAQITGSSNAAKNALELARYNNIELPESIYARNKPYYAPKALGENDWS